MADFDRNEIQKNTNIRPSIDPRYKTLGRRVYAGMVDTALYTVFGLLLELALQLMEPALRFPIYRFAFLPFAILFPIIFTKLLGATPGKLYFHLRVLPASEQGTITWWQSIRRELINIGINLADLAPVLIFFVLMGQTSYSDYLKYSERSVWFSLFNFLALTVFIIEILTASGSTRRRSVHDFLGDTVVVVTGPYRPWSNFVAIGAVILAVALNLLTFPSIHN